MKVLILSTGTGEGHNSAAKAVKEQFEKRGIPCYRGAKISKKFNTANAACNFVGNFFPARQKQPAPEIRKSPLPK